MAKRNCPCRTGDRRSAADRRRDRRPRWRDAGYAVAIHANRSTDGGARNCAATIVAAGGRAAVVTADLSDHEAVLSLVRTLPAAVGPLTLLVNNAGRVRAGRHRQPRSRAVRPAVRRQPARAVVSGREIRRAGSGRRRCVDRQSRRPAGLQAHAAVRVLHPDQKRAAHRDDDAGAGAGAARARQRGRAGADAAVAAAGRGGLRAAGRNLAARRAGRRRRTSPTRCSISPAHRA